MWPFRKPDPQHQEEPQELVFVTTDAAFEFWCRFGNGTPAVGKTLLVQVIRSKREPDGRQLVHFRVASTHPWETVSYTPSRQGPDLQPGELAGWHILAYQHDLGPHHWLGFIRRSYEEAFDATTGWKPKAEYPFDTDPTP